MSLRKKISDRQRRAFARFDPGRSCRRVIAVMATLAPRAQVRIATILREMVQVSDRQDDLRFRMRMRLSVYRLATKDTLRYLERGRKINLTLADAEMLKSAISFALATIPRALANPLRDRGPVLRVAGFVLRAYWHRSITNTATRCER
jgi:hypothetical protein